MAIRIRSVNDGSGRVVFETPDGKELDLQATSLEVLAAGGDVMRARVTLLNPELDVVVENVETAPPAAAAPPAPAQTLGEKAIARARLGKADVVVVRCDVRLANKQRAQLEHEVGRKFPGHRVLVLDDGMTLELAGEGAVAPPADAVSGRRAYEAYVEAARGRSLVSGDPLPKWDDLDQAVRAGWAASARSILEAARTPAGPGASTLDRAAAEMAAVLRPPTGAPCDRPDCAAIRRQHAGLVDQVVAGRAEVPNAGDAFVPPPSGTVAGVDLASGPDRNEEVVVNPRPDGWTLELVRGPAAPEEAPAADPDAAAAAADREHHEALDGAEAEAARAEAQADQPPGHALPEDLPPPPPES